MTMHYEDLCKLPAEWIRKIHGFLGLDPDLIDESAEHHILGNQRRLGCLSEIKFDDAWRTALRPEDVRTFERIAGRLNHHYGYDPMG